jgi:protein-S-isoprenylcysteine O-methyltransferase Ste14
MPVYGYAILAAGWLIWVMPFFLAQRNAAAAQQVDRRSRWGMLLAGIAYTILWQGRFWERGLPSWRLALSILFLASAALLSWTATRALGRHWRLDAALVPGHELVTSGPYRLVRHPIYTSMLCLLLGTGLMITPLVLLAAAVVVFVAGMEIRIRLEEKLLASRFGETFSDYQRRVPAYVPFLR